jgi:hypothetical protein
MGAPGTLRVAQRAAVTAVSELMVPAAKLEKSEHGLAPTGDGWYVLNVRDAEWRHAVGRGTVCVVADDFEGWRREPDPFGVNPFRASRRTRRMGTSRTRPSRPVR